MTHKMNDDKSHNVVLQRRAFDFQEYISGQEIVILLTIILAWILLGSVTDTFFTIGNLKTVLYFVAPLIVIGIGMTAVIASAGIDVSVGSQLAVIMVVVGQLLRDYHLNGWMALGIALGIGAVLGAFNAFLITSFSIHPMIVTFGTLNLYRFIALQIFGDEQVSGIPATFGIIGGSSDSSVFGIPNATWIAVFLGALMWVYMKYWATGRHIYAIGGNPDAARLAGVKVKVRLYQVYILTGVLVGFAALISLGSGGLVQQNVGIGLEMQVIAAVVIGGTSIVGGRGTPLGTVLGAILVGTLSSAITHLGWPNELTNLFIGVCIIIAVGFDLIRERRRARK
ncbi:MAG: ABC transporter permease [Actinomycetaceae bacterium]|nr:ABC transporter permease [Actinomycetaceae bacterium]